MDTNVPATPIPGVHRWKPIQDLPEIPGAVFPDRELDALYEVWERERIRMDPRGVERFAAQLSREWAIETGVIEGVYTLDRGITLTLIDRGISSAFIPHDGTNRDPELVARIIQAHGDVLEGLFAFVKGERELSTSYIKELHAALLRYTDKVMAIDQFGNPVETRLEKGQYKTRPNNPMRPDGVVHEYCPPEHVASEMDRLLKLHSGHRSAGYTTVATAAWLHHAFTQIHPFQDGNGRVARAIASLVFIKDGLFPLVVTRDDRTKYIDALEAADHGSLAELVGLFGRLEKRSLTGAISASVDEKPVMSLEQALGVTRDLLVDLGRIIPKEYLAARVIASALLNIALSRMQTIQHALTADISSVDSTYRFSVGTRDKPTEEISAVAKALQYDPNTSHHYQAALLSMVYQEAKSEILCSFHGVGPAFRGVLVASAYFQSGSGSPVPLSDDIFRFSYQESQAEVVERFLGWLDACLISGLAFWRKSLL